jgi:hypothetical protein
MTSTTSNRPPIRIVKNHKQFHDLALAIQFLDILTVLEPSEMKCWVTAYAISTKVI